MSDEHYVNGLILVLHHVCHLHLYQILPSIHTSADGGESERVQINSSYMKGTAHT
jgi:hypothetical protein